MDDLHRRIHLHGEWLAFMTGPFSVIESRHVRMGLAGVGAEALWVTAGRGKTWDAGEKAFGVGPPFDTSSDKQRKKIPETQFGI